VDLFYIKADPLAVASYRLGDLDPEIRRDPQRSASSKRYVSSRFYVIVTLTEID